MMWTLLMGCSLVLRAGLSIWAYGKGMWPLAKMGGDSRVWLGLGGALLFGALSTALGPVGLLLTAASLGVSVAGASNLVAKRLEGMRTSTQIPARS